MESKWSGWVLILSLCLGSYQAKCGALELCQITAWDPALRKGIPCHLCQVVVSVVGKILQDNRTEEKLRLFLDKKCQYLPFQDWSVKCKRMVDTGILILVQLGKQVLSDPKVVCGTIKLCQPWESPTGALKFQKPPPAPAGPPQDFADLVAPFIANVPLLLHPQDLPHGKAQETDETCGGCLQLGAAQQIVITYFDNELLKNETLAELGDVLEKGCEMLPTPLTDKKIRACDSAKEDLLGSDPCAWGPQYWCKNMVTAIECQEPGPPPLGCACTQGGFVVKPAESLRENNVTEEQLVNDIEKVCYMLPHGIIGQCKDFVDSYGKAVVIMLLEATDPAAICTMLRCCPAF
ncbi:prosaposin-like [Egretta garzetta]|uniref:prosaposin-like n=1 Tax=Egretta garzetta TaxID=188379 RepID=UPI00163D20CC|nr:prosaposin-like [Egretta garzetta]